MIGDSQIRQFVKDALGCTCPDEVLRHIDCHAGVSAGGDSVLDYEINIGNKLLIFVVTINEHGLLEPVISQLVRDGTNKRDQEGFNRFRLVLRTQDPADITDEAFTIFQSLGAGERVHLHVLAMDVFPVKDICS